MEDFHLKVQLQQKIIFADKIEDQFKQQQLEQRNKKKKSAQAAPQISIQKLTQNQETKQNNNNNFSRASTLKLQQMQLIGGRSTSTKNLTSGLQNSLPQNLSRASSLRKDAQVQRQQTQDKKVSQADLLQVTSLEGIAEEPEKIRKIPKSKKSLGLSVAKLSNDKSLDSLQTSSDGSVSLSSEGASKSRKSAESNSPKMPFSTFNKEQVETRESGISNTLLEELDDQIGPLPSPVRKKESPVRKSRNGPRITMSMNNVVPDLKAIKEDNSGESSQNSSVHMGGKANTKRTHASEKNVIRNLITPEQSPFQTTDTGFNINMVAQSAPESVISLSDGSASELTSEAVSLSKADQAGQTKVIEIQSIDLTEQANSSHAVGNSAKNSPRNQVSRLELMPRASVMRMKECNQTRMEVSPSIMPSESKFSQLRVSVGSFKSIMPTSMGSVLDERVVEKLQKKFEYLLNKQINIREKVHRMELKNVESVAFAEASKFIRKHTERIARALTREHHQIIQQFLDYKDRMDVHVEGLNETRERMLIAEQLSALKNQIYEAEYATNEKYALKLYDCLVPKLKEHRKARKEPFTAEEMKQEIILKKELRALESTQKEQDTAEILLLRSRCSQLQIELDCVNWYIQVMEDGKNTKYIMEEYLKQKKTIERQTKEISKLKTDHQEALKKYKNRAKDLHKHLIKMFKEVVDPLKQEVAEKDAEAKQFREENEVLKKDLKLLSACIRLPAMCTQFQKASLRKESQEKNKRLEQNAIKHLSNLQITEKNQEAFFDKHLQKLIPLSKDSRMNLTGIVNIQTPQQNRDLQLQHNQVQKLAVTNQNLQEGRQKAIKILAKDQINFNTVSNERVRAFEAEIKNQFDLSPLRNSSGHNSEQGVAAEVQQSSFETLSKPSSKRPVSVVAVSTGKRRIMNSRTRQTTTPVSGFASKTINLSKTIQFVLLN